MGRRIDNFSPHAEGKLYRLPILPTNSFSHCFLQLVLDPDSLKTQVPKAIR